MICVNCNTPNESDNVFCVNCGNAVTGGSQTPAVEYHANASSHGHAIADSTETAVVNLAQPYQPTPQFPPASSYSGENKIKNTAPMVWVAVGLVAALGLIAVGAFFIVPQLNGKGEMLPDRLGMFVQSATKDRNDEISKQDFSKVGEAKNTLAKNENLATLDAQPSLILYADGQDIPINDLRLIQIDTIKDDGNMKTLDFQVMPIDGKPAMKRIRMADALANGKYAFALLNGYFDEGKHKFWAFQVKNSSKSENGDPLKASSVPLRPVSPAQRQTEPSLPRASVPPPIQPAAEPPAGAKVAYTKTNNVLIRAAPSLYGQVRGKIGSGQPVYVYGYSGYDCFKGQCGSWAQIQTTSGVSGYILSVLLR